MSRVEDGAKRAFQAFSDRRSGVCQGVERGAAVVGLAVGLSLLGLGLDLGGTTTAPAAAAPIECTVTGQLVCSNRPPTARIEVVSTSGRTVFVCDRSTDPEGRPMTRRWSFGDDFFAAEPCLSHTYAKAGSYKIGLVVEDDVTQSDPTSTSVSVQSPTAARSGGAVAAVQPSAPAQTRVIYRDRTRTVIKEVRAEPALVEDQHRTRLANPPRIVLAASLTRSLRAGLAGVLAFVVIGLLLVVIARRRARTSASEFDQMTTDFLSNLSHELRTPLTPVKGFAEILGHHKVSKEKTRAYADAIFDASQRLERVIDTLVGVAEIDAGRTRAHRGRLDLGELVAGVVEPWRGRESARTIRCTGSDVFAVGDPRLISLAVDQMVDNAVKFSSEDTEVHVDVRTDGGRVRIEVTDHGVGIAPRDQAAIFADFRQVDGSTTREHGGLGLGLALVRRVAAIHDGEITVRSTPGVGSTFTLSFPVTATRRRRVAA